MKILKTFEWFSFLRIMKFKKLSASYMSMVHYIYSASVMNIDRNCIYSLFSCIH